MLNHVEIQGKIGNGKLVSAESTTFFIDCKRGFGNEADRIPCIADGNKRNLLESADDGRTVIVTGRLRQCAGGAEIVCETVDFVDGGGANA